MGKKSTDEQVRPEESEGDEDETFKTISDLQLERFNKHLLPPLLYALMRGRTDAESVHKGTEETSASELLQHMLTQRQWEEDHERGRQVKLVNDLLKALRMQEDSES